MTNGASNRIEQLFSAGDKVLTRTGKTFVIEEIGEEQIRFRVLASNRRMSLKRSRLEHVIANFQEIRNSDNLERAVNTVLKEFGDSDYTNEPYLYGLAQECLARQAASKSKAKQPSKVDVNSDTFSDPARSQRRFWVVSPNVTYNHKTIESWKEAIRRHHAAFMGWGPDDPDHKLGSKFANGILPGDVILIARRSHGPDVVAFGVVTGKYQRRLRDFTAPDKKWTNGSIRKLSPFIAVSNVPNRVPIMSALKHTQSLRQLHPDWNPEHRKVCNWMMKALGQSAERNGKQTPGADSEIKQLPLGNKPLVDPTQFDFHQRSAKAVRIARKLEALLVQDFKKWLGDRGHELDQCFYGRFLCDAYEKDRNNLIEAKSSTRREYIRMAVGQLLDYAFLGKEGFGTPNMAILLPKRPKNAVLNWLEASNIHVIWRRGNDFEDNAQGRFL